MASVRAEESLAPDSLDCPVARNHRDRVDGALPFHPLIVCLRFLGVELDPSILNGSPTKCSRYLSLALLFLLLNVFCTISTAVIEHNLFIQIYSNDTPANDSSAGGNNSTIVSVFSWNLIVDYVSYGVLVVGVHASLLFFSRQGEWKLLWDNVRQILQHHNEFEGIRKSIRRVTIAGLLIASLVIHPSIPLWNHYL